MKSTRNKYYKTTIQLLLLKVVLFFYVFSFSGYNQQIQHSYLEPIQNELVLLKKYRSSSIISYQKFIRELITSRSILALKTSKYSWIISNTNRLLSVNYKSIHKRKFSYNSIYIKLPIKIFPSSDDDNSFPFPIV